MKVGSKTPWGRADHVTKHAEGIYSVSTASHGGVKLDRTRNAQVSGLGRVSGGWYEEDIAAVIPMLTFPHAFPYSRESVSLRQAAIAEYPEWYAHEFNVDVAIEESRELRRRAFALATEDKFVVCSALAEVNSFPPLVAVTARKRSEEAYFLIPLVEYRSQRGEFGFVVDPERHERVVPRG